MTLAIAVVTADGVVLATDSRTSGSNRRIFSDYTQKLFEVGGNAVATYGWAFLLGRNIAGHVADLQQRMSDQSCGPEALATQIADFFGERIDEHIAKGLTPPPSAEMIALGFLIGGFEGDIGRTLEVQLPTRTVVPLQDSITAAGACWRGQTDVFSRLYKGFDFSQLASVAATLGVEANRLVEAMQPLEYTVLFQLMNLQDAIDFAVFAIRTTIDTQRLTHGTQGSGDAFPGVGGPIEIAVVTAKYGFRWLQHTDLRGESYISGN